MRRIGFLLTLSVLLVFLTGSCVRLLEPQPNTTKYYLLESVRAPDTATSTSTGLQIGLRRPRLADYLDSPSIVTRRGPNEIHFSDFHRWGENLGSAINRVLALNLEAQPGIQSVEPVPWPRGASFDHVLQLHVLRFEGSGPPPPGPDADDDAPIPEGHVQMTIRWTVLGLEGDSVQTQGRTAHRIEGWPVTDYETLVAKLDSSLLVLAEDLRDRLVTRSNASVTPDKR